MLSLVRIITFDQPVTAREAVPADPGSLRAVKVLLAALRSTIDCARSATALASKTSRAGNSRLATEPEDIQKHVQQKNENLLQA